MTMQPERSWDDLLNEIREIDRAYTDGLMRKYGLSWYVARQIAMEADHWDVTPETWHAAVDRAVTLFLASGDPHGPHSEERMSSLLGYCLDPVH